MPDSVEWRAGEAFAGGHDLETVLAEHEQRVGLVIGDIDLLAGAHRDIDGIDELVGPAHTREGENEAEHQVKVFQHVVTNSRFRGLQRDQDNPGESMRWGPVIQRYK